MKTFLIVLCLNMIISCSSGSDVASSDLRTIDQSWERYGLVLEQFNHDGLIDYADLKNSRGALDSVVSDIAQADQAGMSRNERLAFYINAYNVLTLRAIIDAYPVKSIKDIDGVWEDKNWVVSGRRVSLNRIEHEILRKDFDEPRIHVTINCASISCPSLAEFPFLADSLESQLNLMSSQFARSASHNQIDMNTGEARLSAVFDWFGEDFVSQYYLEGKFPGLSEKKNAGLAFVLLHLSDGGLSDVDLNQKFKVGYVDYDWNLNEYTGE